MLTIFLPEQFNTDAFKTKVHNTPSIIIGCDLKDEEMAAFFEIHTDVGPTHIPYL